MNNNQLTFAGIALKTIVVHTVLALPALGLFLGPSAT